MLTSSRSVLVLGVVLRLALALVNTQANDNHLDVIQVMAFENRIPAKDEFWEAFQPKLYHGTVAAIWRLMPQASDYSLTVAAQLVSCAAGIATLALVAHFLGGVADRRTRLVALALVAFNPALVGINVQATNDSFVIFFATLALWFGWRLFARWQPADYVGLTAATIVAILSKGNGMALVAPIMIAFAAALGLRAWRREAVTVPVRTLALYAMVFTPVVAAACWTLGPYGAYYRQYGSPFVTNQSPAELPHLIQKTYPIRPGLTSVVDGLLTFRYVDLLRHPRNTQGRRVYPRHRTSVWAQVYGRTHSIHFDAWPPGWATSRPIVLNLTRVIFVLALLPTALLLVGIGLSALRARRYLTQRPPTGAMTLGPVLLTLAAITYVAFVAAYSIRYRDFSVMKAIFMLPGLLGFVMLFVDGCGALYSWCAGRPAWRRIVDATFAFLLLCYAADIGILFIDLLRSRFI